MTASAQQRAKRQQRVEELCAASLRALTGEPELHYRGRVLHQGSQRVPVLAPHLRVDSEQDDFADCRGAADATALRLLHSDPAIHAGFRPGDDERVARLMFEWLEQMRVETLVRDDMPGMRDNLVRRFEHWSQDFYRAGLADGALGVLLFTAAQVCWSRLTAQAVLHEAEDHMESTRFALAPRIGVPLGGMRRHRHDQRMFAPLALEVARTVAEMADTEPVERDAGERESDDTPEPPHRLALPLDLDASEGDTPAPATTGESKVFAESESRYRTYTTRHDVEVEATSLVRPALLREYRELLDRRVAAQGVNVPRLARALHALLARPRDDGWQFGEIEGRIDGRRLAQLVSSPAERRIFRRDRQTPGADCLVTLLVDCSGSMKAHSEALATLIDLLLRALEMAGVSSELLGFTTGAWNGGRAARDWQRDGQPAHPGRLNELCHMVFKDAARSWRRSRAGVAALLKADLFREGIDGEAVDWACRRLLARDEPRRILIVVSDGSPNDAATGRANDAFYLDNHLKDVVARREREGMVEIMGLGVGLDLSPFYVNSLATDMSQALDNALLQDIVKLIGRKHRR